MVDSLIKELDELRHANVLEEDTQVQLLEQVSQLCAENDERVAYALSLRSEVQSLGQINEGEKREIEFLQRKIRDEQQQSLKHSETITNLRDKGGRQDEENERQKNKVRSMEAEIDNNKQRIAHQEDIFRQKN